MLKASKKVCCSNNTSSGSSSVIASQIARKLTDFSVPPPTVRSTVYELRHQQEAQRIVLESCLAQAKRTRQASSSPPIPHLNNSPDSSSAATSAADAASSSVVVETSSSLPPITEIASRSETSTTATSLPLSGVVVAVSDCLDVEGFQTRYGVDCKMLHRAPRTDSPFVHWLRSNGASFVGKLRCHTPLSFRENAVLRQDYPPGMSVDTRSCHYAISNSIVGAAGLMAPQHHNVASFKPTMSAFGARQGFQFADGSHSIAVTARYLDDIAFLWEVYTSGGGSNALASSSRGMGDIKPSGWGGGGEEESDTSTPPGSAAADSMKNEGVKLAMRERFSRPEDTFDGRAISEDENDVLTIGIPTSWIDAHASMSGTEFLQKMKELCARNKKMKKKAERVEFEELNIPFDLDSVLPLVKSIADYEVAMRLLKVSEGSSGLLEELPNSLVSAVFAGKKISESEYIGAKLCVDRIARGIEEQFVDVDVICSPLLSTPFQDGNMRSTSLTLPFALVGNPTVTMQLDPVLSPASNKIPRIGADGAMDGFPVQLIGELGRDSGLLEECMSLMSFIEKPKSWWSTSWFNSRK